MKTPKQTLQKRIDAAQGRIPCDLIIKEVGYLDVFSCEWLIGDIAIIDGVIVGVEPGLHARQTVDAHGLFLTPGFIDAHVHVESSMMLPSHFEQAVLSKGTTTAICDPHEIANVVGLPGIQYFLESAESLQLDLRVMLSSCVPATHLETNGGGALSAKDLLKFASHPKALGLAEMMNMPGVLGNDPDILEKLEAFSEMRMDGHCPLLKGQALSAYASVGISSCHESSELEEAREKLQKGISVWIREGSVAKDVEALAPLLTMATSTSVGFCTDDRNPYDIAREGHVDHLVREAIRLGVTPKVAFRAASHSVARHYGLDRGFDRRGAIAPGYLADLVLLSDKRSVAIERVFKRGVDVNALEYKKGVAANLSQTIRATAPSHQDLVGPAGNVHVIEVIAGKIITGRRIDQSTARGVARLSVQERYGHGLKPANAYVSGFGENLQGAIASSVGHDSHNLIVVGSNEFDMKIALSALIESGGGFCVVKNGVVSKLLPLPFGGLMSEKSPLELQKDISELKAASRSIGCELEEPFLQLAFLSLPVIPSLKLTDKGLVDVDQFKFIDVRA